MSQAVFFEDCNWEPWKNGQGLTRVLGGDATWRLSLAEIRTSSSFSIFEGLTREIGLMRGHGLSLQPQDQALAPMVLDRAGVCFAFSGNLALTGMLHDGPVQVLNLMYGAGQRHLLRPITQACRVDGLLALVPVRGGWRIGAMPPEEEVRVAAGTSFLRSSTPQTLDLVPEEGEVPLAYGVFAVTDGAG
ncbi:HutD family protein [Acetobacter okinawensis]|uniref:HutD/Ves family protein n=1 Tax=Acetobacter okinawensis TaxID=1076594 RepID=UPI001BAD5B9A|nr:HutD family protein [Acetobacter okinawensis]MBS0965347.1 HutD family protein [Acetobacter okinawensis]